MKKKGTMTPWASTVGVPQNTSGVPVKPTKSVKSKKKWRTVLKVIIIIILVKILINITLANYFSPDNRIKRYLHAKYGSNRELTVDGGCLADLDGGRTTLGELLQMVIVLPGGELVAVGMVRCNNLSLASQLQR